MWTYVYSDELYHYGIKGQKWGVRRYEDSSGHLTPAGIKRYGDSGQTVNKRAIKEDYGGRGARDRRIKSAMAYRQQKKMARLDKKIDKLKKRNEVTRDFDDDEEWQEIKRYRPEFAKKAEQSFNKIADHRDHKIRMAEIKRKNIDSRRNELIKNLSPAEIENGKKYARREVLGGVAMAALMPSGIAQIGYGVHKYKQRKRINYGTSPG